MIKPDDEMVAVVTLTFPPCPIEVIEQASGMFHAIISDDPFAISAFIGELVGAYGIMPSDIALAMSLADNSSLDNNERAALFQKKRFRD